MVLDPVPSVPNGDIHPDAYAVSCLALTEPGGGGGGGHYYSCFSDRETEAREVK